MRSRQDGFTLLELVVALGAMVVIATVLGGVLRLGSRAWERGELAVGASQRNRDLVAFIGREVRSTYAYPVKDGERLIYFFRGDGDRLSFVSARSDPSPEGGNPLRLVMLFLERSRGLYVWSAPLRGAGLPEPTSGAAQLLDARVQDFRIRYLAESGWVSSWQPKEILGAQAQSRGLRGSEGRRGAGPGPNQDPILPRAVEITLTLSDSRSIGPIALPIFASVDLTKTNPAGKRS